MPIDPKDFPKRIGKFENKLHKEHKNLILLINK